MAAVNAADPYGADFRLDLSVKYQVSDPFSVTLFCQNLAATGDSKRYSYDAGVNGITPYRVAFVEEPTVVGLRADYKF